MTIVVVAGTGTEIGKTWVTAAAAHELLGRGIAVCAAKPAQSFAADSTEPTDADVLAAATGREPHEVCPAHRWLPLALAPPMAAAELGREPFTIAELVAELPTPPPGTITLVETAGGVRSPLAADGDTVEFARAVQPALVVLVAGAGLGTINLVRLSRDALLEHRVAVYLNRFDPGDELHVLNRDWLTDRADVEVYTSIGALADRIAATTR